MSKNEEKGEKYTDRLCFLSQKNEWITTKMVLVYNGKKEEA